MTNYGFESEEELSKAIAAWREMEKRARVALTKKHVRREQGRYVSPVAYKMLTHILQPVNKLDFEAGVKALEKLK